MKIKIEIQDSIFPGVALNAIKEVMSKGRVGKTIHGPSFQPVTDLDGIAVFAGRTKTMDTFIVTKAWRRPKR